MLGSLVPALGFGGMVLSSFGIKAALKDDDLNGAAVLALVFVLSLVLTFLGLP